MPIVKLDYSNVKIQDTYISSSAAGTNYSTNTSLVVGLNGTNVMRGLLKFDLSLIPNNAIINSAKLRTLRGASANMKANIHKVTSAFDFTTVTWNTQPTFDSEIIARIDCYNATDSADDITSLVQQWVNGEANNGLLLEADTAPFSVSTYPSESTNSAYRPYLTIDYSIPTEDKKQVEFISKSYSTPSGGYTGSTILPTGILKNDLIFTTVNYSGAGMGATPSGWTRLIEGPYYGTTERMAIYYKFADGTESGSTTIFNFTASNTSAVIITNTVFRNVFSIKSVSGIKLGTNASTLTMYPPPVSGLTNNSLLLTVGSVSGGNAFSTPAKNFNEYHDYSDSAQIRTHQVQGTYNYDKTSYTSEEMAATPNGGSTYNGATAVLLGPITNLKPAINGTDSDLGSFSEPLQKAYTVTDKESDAVTIIEKLDGVTINTKSTTGANTLDLTAQWNSLSFGKHTVTVEVNDSYDTSRKTVRAWTFIKILANDAPLLVSVEGLQDAVTKINGHKSSIITALRNKGAVISDGEVLDRIASVIQSMSIKRFATGTAVTSSATLGFLSTNGTTLNAYYATVTGIPFKPAIVICVRTVNGMIITSVADLGIQNAGFTLVQSSAEQYRLTGNAQLTDNGFLLPANVANDNITWYALA